jgi:hypothetical protein
LVARVRTRFLVLYGLLLVGNNGYKSAADNFLRHFRRKSNC